MFASLLPFDSQKTQGNSSHKAPARYRPTLDALEVRSLMATGIAASLSTAGTLKIAGTARADTIVVTEIKGIIAVRHANITFKGKAVPHVAAGAVKRISVNGGDGNDTIQLAGVVLKGKAVTVDAGKGNDRVIGSARADDLRGGAGADDLQGGDGDDVLDGGDGNDKLAGGKGADVLQGRAGADQLKGGAGNDKLLGGDGDDTLNGEDGDDRLDGGTGTNILNGGRGANVLVGTLPPGTFFSDKFDFDHPSLDGCQPSDVHMGSKAETCGINAALAGAALQGVNPARHIHRIGLTQRYVVSLIKPSWYDGGANERLDVEVQFDGTWYAWDSQPSMTAQGQLEFWSLLWQRAYLQANGIEWWRDPSTWPEGQWISVQFGLGSVVDVGPYVYPTPHFGLGVPDYLYADALQEAADEFAKGAVIVAATTSSADQLGFVRNHAYTVLGFDVANSTVTIRNPWGVWTKDQNVPDWDNPVRTIPWNWFMSNFSQYHSLNEFA